VRIEGLLAAFPKLMGSDPRQHTYIETDSVRYLYQPLESLYMLIITNKSSNILEDLDTLHILAKLIPEYCRILDEDEVLKNAFTLVFAFDEVIAGGYREKVTVQQIKTFMEMDSQQEKLAHMLETTKLMKARQEADTRAQEISAERLHRSAMGAGGGIGGGVGGGRSSFGYGGNGGAASTYSRQPVVHSTTPSSISSASSAHSFQQQSAHAYVCAMCASVLA
jgi:coatomer subunit delta